MNATWTCTYFLIGCEVRHLIYAFAYTETLWYRRSRGEIQEHADFWHVLNMSTDIIDFLETQLVFDHRITYSS